MGKGVVILVPRTILGIHGMMPAKPIVGLFPDVFSRGLIFSDDKLGNVSSAIINRQTISSLC